jgi:PD-(D/E)XK nuclease superfamily
MEQLKLPTRLDSIEIPHYLSVTRLAVGAPCLLHVVAPRKTLPRTPGGPYAELGRVIHELIDLAIAGQLGNRGIPANVADAFDRLLEQAAARLSLDPETKRYADLSVAFSKREWEKRRFHAISDAENVRSQNRSALADLKASPSEPFSLARFFKGVGKKAAEVPFESPLLRIRGQIDLVNTELNEVTVSDFKSGRILDPDGSLKQETSRQLRLYALAILELAPEKKVALRVVSRGGETVERFDEEARIETWQWLAKITEVLTVGAQTRANDLAVIGPQCAKCDIRPICPVYLDALPELWKRDDTPFSLPLDAAGTVTDVREQRDGYFSIKIVDVAGRTVKVHRLSPERRTGMTAGQDLVLFDLASIEARMTSIGWRHPRNFHEVAMLPTDRTAWTIRVFRSGDQS